MQQNMLSLHPHFLCSAFLKRWCHLELWGHIQILKTNFIYFFPITVGCSVWTVWLNLLLPSCCLLQSSGHPLEARGCMMKTVHISPLTSYWYPQMLLLHLGFSPAVPTHPPGSYTIFHAFLLNSEHFAIPILCSSPIPKISCHSPALHGGRSAFWELSTVVPLIAHFIMALILHLTSSDHFPKCPGTRQVSDQ